ncbi:MAG: 30S ribosomal protein S20 [Deltaproteobacteria bacterium]|nr:30S ribosomal protein S20 [Deltaproteobacteria bacterium]
MANHKSALKRARQNEINRTRNKTTRTKVKNIVKQVRMAVSENPDKSVSTDLNTAKAIIDIAVKKGVIHKNTGSRKISRLEKLANTINA